MRPTLETMDLPPLTRHEELMILKSWWAVNEGRAEWLGSRPRHEALLPAPIPRADLDRMDLEDRDMLAELDAIAAWLAEYPFPSPMPPCPCKPARRMRPVSDRDMARSGAVG